jgi:hypothetical protein
MNVEFLGTSVRLELRLPGVDVPIFVSQAGRGGEAALQLTRGARVNVPIREFRVLKQPDLAGR